MNELFIENCKEFIRSVLIFKKFIRDHHNEINRWEKHLLEIEDKSLIGLDKMTDSAIEAYKIAINNGIYHRKESIKINKSIIKRKVVTAKNLFKNEINRLEKHLLDIEDKFLLDKTNYDFGLDAYIKEIDNLTV